MKKDFFEGKRPSVSLFRKKVSQLPKEEQIKCMQYFFDMSLRIWKTKKAAERRFLRCFVRSYRQEFLEYLHYKTILGELRYPPQDVEDLKKVINLVEQEGYRRRKTNYTSLAFSLLISFDIRMRIKSLADGIRNSTPEADDMLDLIQRRNIVSLPPSPSRYTQRPELSLLRPLFYTIALYYSVSRLLFFAQFSGSNSSSSLTLRSLI